MRTGLRIALGTVAAISVIAVAVLRETSRAPRAGTRAVSATSPVESPAEDHAAAPSETTARIPEHVVPRATVAAVATRPTAPRAEVTPLSTAIDEGRAKELDAAVLSRNGAKADPGFPARAKLLALAVSQAPIPGSDLVIPGDIDCGATACRMHVPTEALIALRPYLDRNGSDVRIETFDPDDGTALQVVYLVPRG